MTNNGEREGGSVWACFAAMHQEMRGNRLMRGRRERECNNAEKSTMLKQSSINILNVCSFGSFGRHVNPGCGVCVA